MTNGNEQINEQEQEAMTDGFSGAAADSGVEWVDQGDGTHAAVVDVTGDDVADVGLVTDGVHTIITDGTEAVMVDQAGSVVAVDPEADGTFTPVTVDEPVAVEDPVVQPPVPPGLEDQTGNPFPEQPGLTPDEGGVQEQPVVEPPDQRVVEPEPVPEPQDQRVVESQESTADLVRDQAVDPVWYLDPGFERSAEEIAEDLDHWFEQTTNYTCAPASAAMVINDFADAAVVSETGVAVYAAENDLLVGEVGTLHMEGIAQILTAHGVAASPVPNGTWEDVDALLESGRSVILGVDASQYWEGMEGAGPAGHAVRIVDVDLEAGVAVLADPGVPDGQGLVVPLEDLDRAWNQEMPLNESESATRVMVVTHSVDSDAAQVVTSEPAPVSEPLNVPIEDLKARPSDASDVAAGGVVNMDLSGVAPGEIVDLPDGGLASNGFVLMAAAVPAPLVLLLRTLGNRRSS